MISEKNIQVIDGAINSTFDIFQISEEMFNLLFPRGTDVAFLDEVEQRLNEDGKEQISRIWATVYQKKVDKKILTGGVHGTLHLTGSYCLKQYYPTRKESDVVS